MTKIVKKLELRIKNCNVVFDEGLGPGVIGMQEIEFERNREFTDLDSMIIGMELSKLSNDMFKEFLEVCITEVDDNVDLRTIPKAKSQIDLRATSKATSNKEWGKIGSLIKIDGDLFCTKCNQLCFLYEQGVACYCDNPWITEVIHEKDYPTYWIPVFVKIFNRIEINGK